MNRSTSWGIGLIIVLILIANVAFGLFSNASSSGDGRSLQWDRFDVAINNVDTAANRFDVTETYAISVGTGPFSGGNRDIKLNRLESIQNVAVYDGQTPLRASCSTYSGTFCAQPTRGYYTITYEFTSQAYSGSQRTITIKYTVLGALRSYTGGDQLYWQALPEQRAFPIRSSTVTLTMPRESLPQVTASYPDTWRQTVTGNIVTWQSPGDLGKSKIVEVRVQYPHDARMSKPSWQNTYDLEQSYIDNWQPVVSLLLLSLTVALTLAGVILVTLRYLTHGRDPKALTVPEFLDAPPTEELPGVVGLLVDERADMRDIMATLVDLARRGYFVIEQTGGGGAMGLFSHTEFEFHRTDKPADDLRGYEATLLRGLFPAGRTETSLTQLREKFYQYIPAIKQQMYTELITNGYFTRSPETTRNLWTWGGIIIMILASVMFWGARYITLVSPFIIVPPVGLGMVGAAAALFGNYMPAKTQKGAQDAVKWRAFLRYLQNVKKFTAVDTAASRFDEFVPYAVAFGIERGLVNQIAPALKSMPTWYYPTYVGGPWYGGYRRRGMTPGGGMMPGSGSGTGGFSLGGPGGLNDMSRSLGDGLNAMSSGLTHMLNSASSAMTSRPKSSGSGRGGFSGGGCHGGGGSGGGRAGFH